MSAEIREYIGPVGDHLKAFIIEKRLLGCKYFEEERLSYEFDRLSCGYDCTTGIPEELVNAFIECKPNWQATTQKRHISFIQNFGKYLQNHDVSIRLHGYTALKRHPQMFTPYIFSHAEIEKLLELSDNIRPNCRNSHVFYPVLFRVLYCTGMRISEALSLKMKDVNLKENTIHVVNPKNHKDRVLPISDSLAQYCRWYSRIIHPIYHEDDYFFMSTRSSGQYYRNNVQVFFTALVSKIGLTTKGYKGGGPHLHCLRHTFCIHSLVKMIDDGIPSGVALQLLSAYMGHGSLSATARYLQLTAEAYPALISKLEEAYSDIFPKIQFNERVKMPYEEDE